MKKLLAFLIIISLFAVGAFADSCVSGAKDESEKNICWNVQSVMGMPSSVANRVVTESGVTYTFAQYVCTEIVGGSYSTSSCDSSSSSYCLYTDKDCRDKNPTTAARIKSKSSGSSCHIEEVCGEFGECIDSVRVAQCQDVRKCFFNDFILREYEISEACEMPAVTEPEEPVVVTEGEGEIETPADNAEAETDAEGNLLTGDVVANNEESGDLLTGNAVLDTLSANGKKIGWSALTLAVLAISGIIVFRYVKSGKRYD